MSNIELPTQEKIHTMSITKAVVGLMYHLYDKEYCRYQGIVNKKGKFLCTIGQALNMCSGYSDSAWDYDGFRVRVETGGNLLLYSHDQLSGANKTNAMEYNNLMYQVLASMMRNVANRFGDFMDDSASEMVEERDWKGDSVYFKGGKQWKWEHTKDGEPLGPHGLWMTQSFAQKFGENARGHVIKMSQSERTLVPGEVWKNYLNNTGHLKQYWNGWWFSVRCAYAVGHVVQIIAITPKGVRIQIYEEDWENDLRNHEEDSRWKFMDKIEHEFGTEKQLLF
jgi:hypothetical protein